VLNNEHKLFIKKSKKTYNKIGYVICPALNNKKVYFNRHGFRHLIRKGKHLREISEQIERLNLIKYAPNIISTSIKIKEFNKNVTDETFADFWSFIKIINDKEIKVVIRQIKGKDKHFFSIMSK